MQDPTAHRGPATTCTSFPPVDSLFRNEGSFQVLDTVTFATFNLPFENTGVVDLRAAQTRVAAYTQTSGLIRLAGGTFFSTGPFALNGGVLEGSGQVSAAVTNAGVIRPGGLSETGTLSITGAYTQTAQGSLALELSGTAAGEFDRLTASGAAVFDGTVAISALDGFQPATGDAFEILGYLNRSGDFSTKSGFDFGAVTLILDYAARAATLRAP
jgi:hypothetical protein